MKSSGPRTATERCGFIGMAVRSEIRRLSSSGAVRLNMSLVPAFYWSKPWL